MSIRIILENQLTCSLTLKISKLDSQNVVLSFIFSIIFLPIQGFGCLRVVKISPVQSASDGLATHTVLYKELNASHNLASGSYSGFQGIPTTSHFPLLTRMENSACSLNLQLRMCRLYQLSVNYQCVTPKYGKCVPMKTVQQSSLQSWRSMSIQSTTSDEDPVFGQVSNFNSF